jgi:hypothetical protein
MVAARWWRPDMTTTTTTTAGVNLALHAMLVEADWSRKAFARAVCRIATAHGQRVAYNHASAARWIAGVTPMPATRRWIAEACAVRLNRPVTLEEIGMPADTAGPRLAELTTAELLAVLTRLGMAAPTPTHGPAPVAATDHEFAAQVVKLTAQVQALTSQFHRIRAALAA